MKIKIEKSITYTMQLTHEEMRVLRDAMANHGQTLRETLEKTDSKRQPNKAEALSREIGDIQRLHGDFYNAYATAEKNRGG